MGIMDFISKQFIDVIEWNEERDGVLAYRYPMSDQEIQNGAKLTVRETQMAMFVNEGKVADILPPGLHTLTTQTLPVLTSLKNWDKLFASPFKSDVYFFSTRLQTDQKWGTPAPITIRDKDFGAIRMGAHGIYSYKVKDVKLFWEKVSGTRALYTTAEFEGQLRSIIITSIASFLGSSAVSFVDMAANQTEFSKNLKQSLEDDFQYYGLELDSFFVQSLSLPEELQKKLDESSSMRIIGDLRNYTQFQTAQSIPLAAANEGGVAGAGASMGAGLAMGQAMMQGFQNAQPGSGEKEAFDKLEKLHDLMKKGVISNEEFEKKKADLLSKI